MKEIYFGKGDAGFLKRVSKNLMFYGTETMGRAFPDWSLGWAEKMLCAPTRPLQPVALAGFEETTLQVRGHELRVYSKGNSNRIVIFAHGWSGNATNFTSFYDRFLEQGYRVIAFDHVAHGNSTGTVANLFMFIEGTRAVLKWAADQVSTEGEIAGIVAHSMGASAMISVLGAKDKNSPYRRIPLTLIAPVIPLFESLQISVDNFGISRLWLTNLLRHLEVRYDLRIQDIDPKERIKDLTNPVVIVHDTKDSYIPLELNRQYLPSQLESALVTTERLGHFRILKASPVANQALGFIHDRKGV